MAAVALDGVRKCYGDVVALADLSMAVDDRELLVILGPSGSGKSTILRLIAGLEEPDEGRLLIGGEVVNDVEPLHRDVAMVFQSYALYPHLTCRGNIEFPLRRRHVPKEERDRRVAEAAASLGLSAVLARKPAKLSGGQRQRVALARAVVRRPAVFLMDEPLSNLDAQLRAETRAELIELHRRLSATFVYVTHDQVEAMTMATRVAVMSEGVLQQLAPPAQVYDEPANATVARFVGNPPMNVLTATIARDDAGVHLLVGPARLGLTDRQANALGASPRTSVLVGVRPENVRSTGPGPGQDAGGGQDSLRATVRSVELLGPELTLSCQLVDGQRVTVREPRGTANPRPGDAVRLGVEPRHVHLFDDVTHRRVDA
jgi:multiple sugar transport system ATP-binding protein